MLSARAPRRFVITNTVALNGGDAAILCAIVGLLRRRYGEDVRIDVFDSQAEAAQRYYPDLRFHQQLATPSSGKKPRREWSRRLYRLQLLRAAQSSARKWWPFSLPIETQQRLDIWRQADVIISTGGTYLVEKYSIRDRILDFELAHALRAKLALFTQSIGAFRDDPRSGALSRSFRYAKLLLLRDECSLQHAISLCGSELPHFHVCPDVVFSMADRQRLDVALARTWPESDAHVLVSVRNWSHFEGRSPEEGQRCYRASVAALVTELVRRGARVTFVSTCQGIAEYWQDDSKEAQVVYELLDGETQAQADVLTEYHSPEVLIKMAGEADLVIATRLHMAILTLCAGTPVLPIAYEHKTVGVFAQVDPERPVLDISEITPRQAEESLATYLETLSERRPAMMAAVQRLSEGAEQSAELLDAVLTETDAPPGGA